MIGTSEENSHCSKARLDFVPLDKIYQSTPLIRIYRPSQWVEDLAENVKEEGIYSPVHLLERKDGSYSIIDGYHRVHAVRKAGLKEILAFVYKEGEVDVELLAFKLNRFQHKLDPFSTALIIKKLRTEYNYDWNKISKITGYSVRHCQRYFELLEKIPEETLQKIFSGEVSPFKALKTIKGEGEEPRKVRHDVAPKEKRKGHGVSCPICNSFPEKGRGKWIYLCPKHETIFPDAVNYIKHRNNPAFTYKCCGNTSLFNLTFCNEHEELFNSAKMVIQILDQRLDHYISSTLSLTSPIPIATISYSSISYLIYIQPFNQNFENQNMRDTVSQYGTINHSLSNLQTHRTAKVTF